MDEEYTINHFSISLPKNKHPQTVPDLLRHAADAIDELGVVWIANVVYNRRVDVEDGEQRPYLTVYYDQNLDGDDD